MGRATESPNRMLVTPDATRSSARCWRGEGAMKGFVLSVWPLIATDESCACVAVLCCGVAAVRGRRVASCRPVLFSYSGSTGAGGSALSDRAA